MAKCYIHKDSDAVEKCSKCGKDICKECAFDYHGKILCKACVMPVVDFFAGGSLHGDVGPPKIVFDQKE